MILGAVIAFFSWTSVSVNDIIVPKQIPGSGDIIIWGRPPHSSDEYIMLGLRIAVFIGGLLQWKAHIRAALLQIISGGIIFAIYLYTAFRSTTNTVVGDRVLIYYFSYASFILGIIIVVIGLAQMVMYWKGHRKTVKAQE
jgi:hypothetical protein